MNHIYAHKFSSTYGESAISASGDLTDVAKTWASGLRELTGEHFVQGIDACINSDDEWPPTLNRFKKICRPDRAPLYHRDVNGRADLTYVALPRRAITPEKLEEYMRNIRTALRTASRDGQRASGVQHSN